MIYLIRQSQQVQVENQQLRAENLLNQYEALKSQLNPHMLFNSLNTLRSLIRRLPGRHKNICRSYPVSYVIPCKRMSAVVLLYGRRWIS